MDSRVVRHLSQIFHAYDIRGVYGKDITEEVVEVLGRAFGAFYQERGVSEVVVGRDNRVSSPLLHRALVQGLTLSGCSVVDLGIVTTPMIYFSWYQLDARATLMVTASHNPAEYNGIKATFNKEPFCLGSYQEIERLAKLGRLGKGMGRVRKYDIWPAYKKRLLKDVAVGGGLKVVFDTGNGTCGLFVSELLKSLRLSVKGLFTKSDGVFPNHPPYPQKTQYYSELRAAIKKDKADFGLAFDGDGDRLGVYDEKGDFVASDKIAALFARSILESKKDSSVVLNVSSSLSAVEDIEEAGGKVVFSRTGYPFVTSKMREVDSPFGAEISGHFFFKDRYFGYDDALYAALRFIELMADSEVSVSQLVATLPKYETLSEMRVAAPRDKDRFEIVEKFKSDLQDKYSGIDIMDIDGVRFTFPDKSWGLVRASNTENVIAWRAEAKTKERVKEMKRLIQVFLRF